MTKVVHCKRDSYDVYIGRPRRGEFWGFGNPFRVGIDGVQGECAEKFRAWLVLGTTYGNLDATPERRQWILDNVKNLKDQTIGCWCKPKKCHGDVLAEIADSIE